jgi:hypothetical protein
MSHDEPRLVWTSLTSTHHLTRAKRIVRERMVVRRSVTPISNLRPVHFGHGTVTVTLWNVDANAVTVP